MSAADDAQRLADYCRRTLDFASATLGEEFGYSSVALCVIDAVWSIGVRYEGVTNVIRRYCSYVGATPDDCMTTLSTLTTDVAARGIEFYADHVFQNRQRTSTRGGILKAEAVYRYASVLRDHGIDTLSDVRSALPNEAMEEQLGRIPGHGSGIAVKYFLMLTGSYDQVKPDRMILRYVEAAVGRQVGMAEAERLLAQATGVLRSDHPQLDARLLDNLIWTYQRSVA